jgi:hypothetical protein
MGDVLVQEINDNCGKTTHVRTMDGGFTTNANDKTDWKCFRIFRALPTYLPTYLPTHPPTYLPTHPPTYLPPFVSIYTPTYIYTVKTVLSLTELSRNLG